MSIECRECERDIRGGHDLDCSLRRPTHGPDDECSQCRDCPECDGSASYGQLVELAPGVLTLRCPTCGGAGVWCPNYDFDPAGAS